MYPAEQAICGLIEFDAGEARIVLQSRCASDETLQATLISLAQDRMDEIAVADPDEIEWPDSDWDQAEVLADFAALEKELLLIYHRVKSR